MRNFYRQVNVNLPDLFYLLVMWNAMILKLMVLIITLKFSAAHLATGVIESVLSSVLQNTFSNKKKQ